MKSNLVTSIFHRYLHTTVWWEWISLQPVEAAGRQAGRDLRLIKDWTFHLKNARNYTGSRLPSGCQWSGMQLWFVKQLRAAEQRVRAGTGCCERSEVHRREESLTPL